jgi:hypothetical protein
MELQSGQLTLRDSDGGGLFTAIPVTPEMVYLVQADVVQSTAVDLIAVHEIDSSEMPVKSRWFKMSSPEWFPRGTIVQPSLPRLDVYLYSDEPTEFVIRQITLSTLEEVAEH